LLPRKQTNPSDESVTKAREQFEQSTSIVIDVQLAFDEASRSEVRANEDAESGQDGPESLPTREQWALSRVGLRQERLVEEIPAFKELSLTRLGTPIQDERSPGHGSHELERQYTSRERYDQIKQEAPLIVKQLLICWTNIKDDRFLDAGAYQRPGPATRRAGEFPPSNPGAVTPNAPYDKCSPNSEANSGWTRTTEYFANEVDSNPGKRTSMNTTLNSFPGSKTGSVTQATPQMNDEQEEPDILFFTLDGFCKNLPLHFKHFSIDDRRVTIGDIQRNVDLLGWRPNQFAFTHFVRLFYKGTLLENGSQPARALGVKHGSKIHGEHLIWRLNDTAIPFLHTKNAPNPSQAKVRPTYSKPSVEEDGDGLDSSNSIRNSKGPSLVQSSSKESPFPRSSYSAYPNHPVVPKPNPSFGAHRHTKFARTDTEVKHTRDAAEQWEKSKENERQEKGREDAAETRTRAFRGWEQMKSNAQQNFQAPREVMIPQLYSTKDHTWRQSLHFLGTISAAPDHQFWNGVERWATESWRSVHPLGWECEFGWRRGIDRAVVRFKPGKYGLPDLREETLAIYLGPGVNTTVLIRACNALHWWNYKKKRGPRGMQVAGMSAVILASYVLCIALLPHEQRRKEWLEMIRNEEYYILNGPLDWDLAMANIPSPDRVRQPQALLEICFVPGNPRRKPSQLKEIGGSAYDWLSMGIATNV
jgi:hypothetical protein